MEEEEEEKITKIKGVYDQEKVNKEGTRKEAIGIWKVRGILVVKLNFTRLPTANHKPQTPHLRTRVSHVTDLPKSLCLHLFILHFIGTIYFF